jgi:hypothetical protein
MICERISAAADGSYFLPFATFKRFPFWKPLFFYNPRAGSSLPECVTQAGILPFATTEKVSILEAFFYCMICELISAAADGSSLPDGVGFDKLPHLSNNQKLDVEKKTDQVADQK